MNERQDLFLFVVLTFAATWLLQIAVVAVPVPFFPGASFLDFPLYAARVVALSVVIGCLFERAGRRTLVAVAAHLGVNATVLHLPPEPLPQAILTAVFVGAGLVAAWLFPGHRQEAAGAAANPAMRA